MSLFSSPAALRNCGPIADVLAAELPAAGLVLEIASGSGEHVVHFAKRFRHLDFQPSDPDPDARASITGYLAEAALPNIRQPIALDAAAAAWPVAAATAVVNINMVHISPWASTEGLMAGAAQILPAGGLLYLYGPFLRKGAPTADSNHAFDVSLKARNPEWGLRELTAIETLAGYRGLTLKRIIEMPANNLSLIFRH